MSPECIEICYQLNKSVALLNNYHCEILYHVTYLYSKEGPVIVQHITVLCLQLKNICFIIGKKF